MRSFRMTIGVCVALMAVFAAISVASASAAEPALYECAKLKKNSKTKKYEGKYEKGCEKTNAKGEGKYEIKEGIGKGKAFKGKSKGSNLEVRGFGGITCTSSTDTGKFTSPTTGDDIVATFKGCQFNGKKCESGATAGEIVTNKLSGGVGYLEKGAKPPKVGVDIKAETGEVLAAMQCSLSISHREQEFEVIGSVIAEVTPLNKFTKEATFNFEQKGLGVQRWTKLEGEPEDTLTAGVCTECAARGKKPREEVLAESDEEGVFVTKGEELMLKA
jgi:hypothetical protein